MARRAELQIWPVPVRPESYNWSMDTNACEILKQALSLPSEARAALADYLLDSLGTNEDEYAQQEWLDEIRKRIAELDSGAAHASAWAEVRVRLNNQIDR